MDEQTALEAAKINDPTQPVKVYAQCQGHHSRADLLRQETDPKKKEAAH